MKRMIVTLLAVVMSLSLCSCKTATLPVDEPEPQSEASSEVQTTACSEQKQTALLEEENWPIIDGATAFLPFYQEMAAHFLNITTEEAADYVMCSTTDYAYPYLWQGTVDMVFCLEPSNDQVLEAAKAGVSFEMIPFAREGFVFFVNKDNPVDSITISQLHDIYAGKITNWKELGGNDEEIIAYQRSEGSGSQTGLYHHIINKFEVQEPPMEKRLDSMFLIIDAVSGYENSAGALGYSYRYFVTNMHYDERIKMLKVEGVYPDYDSIADGTYPLISNVCAVFRKNTPEDSAVRQIADWCCSSEGAALAKALGYVPAVEASNTPYHQRKTAPASAEIDYAKGNPCPSCSVMHTFYANNITSEDVPINETRHSYIQISGLKNKAVQNAINQKIMDTYMELYESEYPPYPGLKTRISMLDDSATSWFECTSNIQGSFNNILSILIKKRQETHSSDTDVEATDIRTLNFDLNTGKEIYIGDLFADNIDGIDYINEQIAAQSDIPEAFDEYIAWEFSPYPEIHFCKAFEGISRNQKYFIASNGDLVIVLDYNNPEIVSNFPPTYFSIDMKGINAYESRFMHDGSLFEDEAKKTCLFYNTANVSTSLSEPYSIKDWSEGRNIDFGSYRSDDIPASITDAATLRDAHIAELKKEIESQYDAYEAAGHHDIDACFDISYSATSYGDYINSRAEISFTFFGKNIDGHSNHRIDKEKYEHLCFVSGKNEPISLEELFAPGCDANSIMTAAAIKIMKKGNAYSDETYAAMFRELLENNTGFSVDEDALSIYCPLDNIRIKRYASDCGNRWSELRFSLPYAEIGEDNLVIFN